MRDGIDEKLRGFLLAQHLFFTATAPSGGDGHVNVSPKGVAGSFAVLGPRAVAYLDLTGSGAETIAHLRQNGRICLMFCAFDGPPASCACTAGARVTRDDARFAGEPGGSHRTRPPARWCGWRSTGWPTRAATACP